MRMLLILAWLFLSALVSGSEYGYEHVLMSTVVVGITTWDTSDDYSW